MMCRTRSNTQQQQPAAIELRPVRNTKFNLSIIETSLLLDVSFNIDYDSITCVYCSVFRYGY